MPARIIHITEAAGGGVRRHLQLVLPALLDRGFCVELMISARRAETDSQTDTGVYAARGGVVTPFDMVHGPAPRQDLRAIRKLRHHLRRQAPCIVHCHATKAGLIARRAARPLPSVATVYSPHAFAFEGARTPLTRFLLTTLETWLKPDTDRFVFVSQAEAETARRALKLDPARATVIENGLPADIETQFQTQRDARAILDLPPDIPIIGVPGRLTHQKGQDLALQAFAAVRGRLPAATRLLFLGTGPAETGLRRLALDLGLGADIVWAGYVPRAWRFYRACDVLLLPSRYEGLSYTLLEALASGVPLVATAIAANLPRPELRSYASYVNVEDVAALGAAMVPILAHAEPWRHRARDAARVIMREFPLERQIGRLAEIYHRLGASLPPP